jgi:hypothetical protein
MIVVPNLKTAKQALADFQDRCMMASADNGWVDGKAWIEWFAVFCEWLELYRERVGMPDQPAVPFADGAPEAEIWKDFCGSCSTQPEEYQL